MNGTATRATRIARNPRVAFHPLGEENGGVLLHLETGAYHGLNPTGFLIWQLLEQEREFRELLTLLRDRVESAPPSFDVEIWDYVAALAARDLVKLETKA